VDVADVSVDPAHQVAAAGVEALPEALALAGDRIQLRQHVLLAVDDRTLGGGDRDGVVVRPAVHDHDLVHQA
jgi:hypothetical protein